MDESNRHILVAAQAEAARKLAEGKKTEPDDNETYRGKEAETSGASSAGTKLDLSADTNIAKVLGGYFSNPEIAQSFVNAGIAQIESMLPKAVRYADFGGGQGFLTKVVAEWLKSRSHTVDATVIDANPTSLQVAQAEGLQTQTCNLQDCTFAAADLITMRAVNHYNAPERQLEILRRALRSLKDNGFLVSQISSGSEENCRLRSEIVNLSSAGRVGSGERCHMTAVEEYKDILREAGFTRITFAGYAPGSQWSPQEQWDRVYEKEMRDATAQADTDKIKDINDRKKEFLVKAYDLINDYIQKYGADSLGIDFAAAGVATIHYQYPIIISQK